ncbi:hypothetical protein [Kribbella sp. CA-293567]|uniref:hypothetical protein n=1 Tax=Kribbella sp. CA-293567 TaxID=3002436 RepID=UPI0022DE7CB4|nr:hypothetical protein [Kribbella sp. CA-293567]WBQ02297.1 hypothetical protein OX958_20140 [Kribbella sp. CA-293567]
MTEVLISPRLMEGLRWRRGWPDYPEWVEQLGEYRQRLEDAWSDDTLHESFRTPPGESAPGSRGQCGVSSAWLASVLIDRNIQGVTYCYGDVFTTGFRKKVALALHCWIEIEITQAGHRLIVDLTGDQSEILRDHQVLYGWHKQLPAKNRVKYVAQKRLTPEELKQDPVQRRLALLLDNLSNKSDAARPQRSLGSASTITYGPLEPNARQEAGACAPLPSARIQLPTSTPERGRRSRWKPVAQAIPLSLSWLPGRRRSTVSADAR